MNELMTLDAIAELYGCSARHARDVILQTPGFPAEAPGSTPRNRRWVRSEIRAFIHRKPSVRQNPANDPESRASA